MKYASWTPAWPICLLALFLCWLPFKSVSAQAPANRVPEGLLPGPEWLIQNRLRLALSDKQVAEIQKIVGSRQPKFQETQGAIEAASKQLAAALAADTVSDVEALLQLQNLMEAENRQRSLQLQTLLQLRRALTDEQRRLVSKMLSSSRARRQQAGPNAQLRAKVNRIQQTIRSLAARNTPPIEAMQRMQQLAPLLQTGKIDEADKLLDEISKLLDLSEPPGGPPAGGAQTSRVPLPSNHEPAMNTAEFLAIREQQTERAFSPIEVEQQIAAMKKKDVAWRKIPWKTCLLEGLAAAKKQNKPIMLWIFIDRPIDDERC